VIESTESAALPAADAASGFAHDVCAGLTCTGQKSLPPKYLYDALGSRLFESITQLPEYGLWRAERELLQAHAEEVARIAPVGSVIELGSGSANKSVHLLRAQLRRQPVAYTTIDLSPDAIEMTRSELSGLRGLQLRNIQAEYLPGLELALRARAAARPVLVLFLGSSLGNFDYAASRLFLRRIRRALHPGDALLLGADLQQGRETMLAAYDDALGVTAAFNRNLLVRMNRELGADFRVARFRHRARYNATTHDVEMHLESDCEQQVEVAGARCRALFHAGETIHTESSHKYSIEEVDTLALGSGFGGSARWVGTDWRFMSALYHAI